MGIEDEFAKNRRIIVATNKKPAVSVSAFKKFEQKHGPEVAKGYLLALRDVYKRIEKIMVMDEGPLWCESTANSYKKRTKLFHKQLEDFFNEVQPQVTGKSPSPDF